MDRTSLVIHYLHLNVMLLVSGFILVLLMKWNQARPFLKSVGLLRMAYWVLGLSFLFVFLFSMTPSQNFLASKVELWSAISMRTPSEVWGHGAEQMTLPVVDGVVHEKLSVDRLQMGLFLGLGFGFIFVFIRALFDLLRILIILRRSYLLRSVGRIKILVSDSHPVPFSFWTPLSSYVVVPTDTVSHFDRLRVTVLHELQHHRQGDTVWIHAMQVMRVFFFANPMAHYLNRELSELQEFACDEALIDQKNVSPHAYGRYLLEVAQSALGPRHVLVGAAGMTTGASSKILKRRIETMLDRNNSRRGALATSFLFVSIVMSTFGSAYATRQMIQDHRISLDDAKAMVQKARVGSKVPITLNEAVLNELNRYLGTPDGRKFVRESLVRMKNYEKMIATKATEHEIPQELIAVAFVESGFQNLSAEKNPVRAAGVWQFIASTARRFGMRVNSEVDDRLNINVETEAAMRYLRANHVLFDDWLLASLAYNVGESRLRKGIDVLGTRDPWKLVEAGQDPNRYLAKLTAAILILKNPDVVL